MKSSYIFVFLMGGGVWEPVKVPIKEQQWMREKIERVFFFQRIERDNNFLLVNNTTLYTMIRLRLLEELYRILLIGWVGRLPYSYHILLFKCFCYTYLCNNVNLVEKCNNNTSWNTLILVKLYYCYFSIPYEYFV